MVSIDLQTLSFYPDAYSTSIARTYTCTHRKRARELDGTSLLRLEESMMLPVQWTVLILVPPAYATSVAVCGLPLFPSHYRWRAGSPSSLSRCSRTHFSLQAERSHSIRGHRSLGTSKRVTTMGETWFCLSLLIGKLTDILRVQDPAISHSCKRKRIESTPRTDGSI